MGGHRQGVTSMDKTLGEPPPGGWNCESLDTAECDEIADLLRSLNFSDWEARCRSPWRFTGFPSTDGLSRSQSAELVTAHPGI
jgi:hypothetical protein